MQHFLIHSLLRYKVLFVAFDADGSVTIDGGITPGDANAIINNSVLNFYIT